MKYRVPSYFDQFTCIGGACEDTCCAGWYLPVDEATYKKYKKVKDPVMKRRLEKELVARKGTVSIDNVAKIKLKNNRCAFLAGDGLCELYTQLGEHYLSESCQLYPRTFNQVNGILECSLTLSCPEAARKVLLDPKGISFKEEERSSKQIAISASLSPNPQKPKHYGDYLLEIRGLLLGILQNRQEDFEQRFLRLENTMKELDYLIKTSSLKKIPSFIQEKMKKADLRPIKGKVEQGKWRQHERLLEILKHMRSTKKWPSTYYEALYEEVLKGLESNVAFNVHFAKGYVLYKETFLKEYSYILENYFVNYIYEREAPLDGESLLQSLDYLKVYKAMIELHLVGLIHYHKGVLTEEKIVQFLQLMTRVFDHNELYRKQLLSVMKK